jgi:transposase
LTESSKRGFRPFQEELHVMARPKKYPDELMDRGVRLVFESGRPIAHVARDLGVSAEALRKRVRRAEVDAGKREGLSSDDREELRRLRAEVFELRRANSILKEASVYFARELDPNRPS